MLEILALPDQFLLQDALVKHLNYNSMDLLVIDFSQGASMSGHHLFVYMCRCFERICGDESSQLWNSNPSIANIDVSDDVENLLRLSRHIFECNFESTPAIIAHLVAVRSVKGLVEELQLHLTSANIFFLAVAHYRIQSLHLLSFAHTTSWSLSVALIQEIVGFPITVAVIEDTLGRLLVSACSTTLLD